MCSKTTYNDDIFASECSECTNMLADSDHGYYYLSADKQPQTNPNCLYKCNDGLTNVSENPYCLENFDLFLQNIGGPIIFTIMIASTVLIIVLMLIFIMQKNKYKTIDKMIEQGEKALKEPTAQSLEDTENTNLETGNYDKSIKS